MVGLSLLSSGFDPFPSPPLPSPAYTCVQQRIQGTLDLLAEQLIGGKKVTLLNFGVFSVKDVAARVGRNPSTGEALAVPAKKSPRFAFSKKFKDAINAKK